MKKKGLLVVILSIITVCLYLAGCSAQNLSSPQDVIKDAYGNTEYTISFNSEGLDAPIADITYTANSMPTLPTPTRVGYVFGGWYFDASYTKPYMDGILHLYMRDVTLYAKWEREAFSANGTYEIEYTAEIVEGSVREGALASLYGYNNLADDIISDETYIEKSNDGFVLKLQYDCGALEPLTMSSYPAYNVSISALTSDSSIYIEDTINSYTDTVKTLFIDISEENLSEPIYFNVTTTNWRVQGLSDDERIQTTTSYTLKFEITRLIGFSEVFEDTSVPLEDGYYSARTYIAATDLSQTMVESFNPVYSYIIAEDGNYTLIKPFYPYFGIAEYEMGGLLEPTSANFYYRMSTFMPVNACFGIDISEYEGQGGIASDYFPETYHADYYRDLTVEFNAETGNMYYIIDLGNNLNQALVLSGSPTGFMEISVDIGEVHQVLTLDTNHVVRITEIAYEPITGDYFTYEEEFQYYPGALSDLNSRGLTYDATEQMGLSTSLINYFYTATSANSEYTARTAYSSRITYSATDATNARSVADSRYQIAYLTATMQIYGYDAEEAATTNKKLYADEMTLSTFTTANIREWNEIRVGKSLANGETVNVSQLFAEKVNSKYSFTGVTWQAYAMNSGNVDFSSPVTVESSFVFDRELAILFTYNDGNSKATCLVELIFESEPELEIVNDYYGWHLKDGEDDVYVSDSLFELHSRVYYPYISYQWGYTSGSLAGQLFNTETYVNDTGVNVARVGRYTLSGGNYQLDSVARNTLEFTMGNDYYLLAFQITNVYGEHKIIYFEYTASESETYSITDSSDGNGNTYASGEFEYENDGTVKPVEVSVSEFMTANNMETLLSREFYYHTGTTTARMNCLYYSIFTDSQIEKNAAYSNLATLIEDVKRYSEGSGYTIISIVYGYGDNRIYANYVCRVTFGGTLTYSQMEHDEYFTDYVYTISPKAIYGYNGELIGSYNVSIRKYVSTESTELMSTYSSQNHYSITNVGGRRELIFNSTGKYRIYYTYSVSAEVLHGVDRLTLEFYEDVYVYDGKGNVTITYVTDEEHPFTDKIMNQATPVTEADGKIYYYYTVTYSLLSGMETLSEQDFAASEDLLFGWSMSLNGAPTASNVVTPGTTITDYIARFNNRNGYVYTIWDPGITVKAVAEGNNTVTRTYTRSSSGYYVINLSDFAANPPVGYVFVGWTGGFLGDGIFTGSQRVGIIDYEREDLSEYLTINAVFRQQISVSYSVNSKYSSSAFRNEIVTDGFAVTTERTAIAREGYIFFGWKQAMAFDQNGNITELADEYFDFSTAITIEMANTEIGTRSAVVFVAVFQDAEGNLVW